MITVDFLRAGKAIFTVSNNSGKHYTFRVTRKVATASSPEVYFVGLLTGSDNTRDYTTIGRLMPDNTFQMSRMAQSIPSHYSKPGEVLTWALKMIVGQKELPAGYSISHAGSCGRCARTLTTPKSLASGIGPECEKKTGMVA